MYIYSHKRKVSVCLCGRVPVCLLLDNPHPEGQAGTPRQEGEGAQGQEDETDKQLLRQPVPALETKIWSEIN